MSTTFYGTATSYRWLIFWIMGLAYVGAYFHRISTAVVASDIQETLGITASSMGLLASAYFYSYAVIQFPAGLLSDSLGPRKAASLFLVMGAVGSVLMGLAPDLGTALVGRVLVGLGAGMVFTPTMKIISEWFRAREFSRMNSVFLATGGVGSLTAAAPLALVTAWVGWRASFEIMGLVTVLMACLVWLFVRNRPQEVGLPPIWEMEQSGVCAASPSETLSLWQGAKRVLTNVHFWPIAVWSFCTMGIFFGFGGLWAGPYLMHVYGMSRGEVGSVLNMLAVGIILGSPGMSFLSQRVMSSRKKVLWLSSVALAAELLFLVLFPAGLSSTKLYVVILTFAILCAAPAVVSVTSVKELFPLAIVGTCVGTVNCFSFLGAAFMQLAMGWVLDAYPKNLSGGYALEAYWSMLVLMLAISVVALCSTFFMKDTFSRAPNSS